MEPGPGFLHDLSIRKSEDHPALVDYSCRACPRERAHDELSLLYPVWLLLAHIPLSDAVKLAASHEWGSGSCRHNPGPRT